MQFSDHHRRRRTALNSNLSKTVVVLAAALLSACATQDAKRTAVKETVWAVTATHQLIKFEASAPERILDSKPLSGLAANEALVGIDFRVARGILYALAGSGQLYTIDTRSGSLKPVGNAPGGTRLTGSAFGFDFNPTVDRIRVVGNDGQNLRLHPDTGTQVDSDPQAPGVQADGLLAYAADDANAGKAPQVTAAAYTYNKQNDKITTNFAIDRALGTLVTQGTREGVQPAVSPNTGKLFTVGKLGLGAVDDVAFDISDVKNTGLAAIAKDGGSRLYEIDLQSGRAYLLGTIGTGAALRGMAIEP